MYTLMLHPRGGGSVLTQPYRWNLGRGRWEYWSVDPGAWSRSTVYSGEVESKGPKHGPVARFEDTWAEPVLDELREIERELLYG